MRHLFLCLIFIVHLGHSTNAQIELLGSDTFQIENKKGWFEYTWQDLVNHSQDTVDFYCNFNVPDTLRRYLFVEYLDFILHYHWGSVPPCGDERFVNSISPGDAGRLGFGVAVLEEVTDEAEVYLDSLSWELLNSTCDSIYTMRYWQLKKATSTNGHSLEEVAIYPNPAFELITIEGIRKDEACAILDISGNTVKMIPPGEGQVSISNLGSGMYFLKVHGIRGIRIVRFLKL